MDTWGLDSLDEQGRELMKRLMDYYGEVDISLEIKKMFNMATRDLTNQIDRERGYRKEPPLDFITRLLTPEDFNLQERKIPLEKYDYWSYELTSYGSQGGLIAIGWEINGYEESIKNLELVCDGNSHFTRPGDGTYVEHNGKWYCKDLLVLLMGNQKVHISAQIHDGSKTVKIFPIVMIAEPRRFGNV